MDRALRSAENRSAITYILAVLALAVCAFAGSYLVHLQLNKSAALAQVEQKLNLAALLSQKTDLDEGEISELLTAEATAENIAAGEEILGKYGYSSGSVLGGEYAYSSHIMADLLCALGVLLAGILGFVKLSRIFTRLRGLTEQTEHESISDNSPDRDIHLLALAIQTLCEKNARLVKTVLGEKRYLADYLHDFSHQIKTPCTGLVLNNDILLNNPMDFEEQQEYFENNKHCLERISLLCESSLKLARLDAGAVEYRFEEASVNEIVQGAMVQLKAIAEKSGTALENKVDPALTLRCDKLWLCEALTNLIKNAIEHTPGGTVTVSSSADPIMLSLTVSDNGCGISEEDLPMVFRRFYSRSARQNPRSVGIGMSIAKKITEDMRGKVFITSEIGKGTQIRLEFFQTVT